VIAAEAERHEVSEDLQEASSQRRGHGDRGDAPPDASGPEPEPA